jgi:hypothetical protein
MTPDEKAWEAAGHCASGITLVLLVVATTALGVALLGLLAYNCVNHA